MVVNIWVTTLCNLNCTYCYEKENTSLKADMDLVTADSIISYIKMNYSGQDSLYIRFHGGEPLLNFEMIRHIVLKLVEHFGNIVNFYVTTNATLLDTTKLEFFYKYAFNISISIDGKRETNDRYRVYPDGSGTYNKVIDILRFMDLNSKNISARITVLPDTAVDLFENVIYLIDILGFRNVNVYEDYISNWDEKSTYELKNYYKSIKDYCENDDFRSKDIAINSALVFQFYKKEKGICGFGSSYFQVYVDGSVFPCVCSVGDDSLVLGNIKENPFSNLELIEYLRNVNRQELACCKGCDLYKSCVNTRCKLVNRSFSNDGDFFTPVKIACKKQKFFSGYAIL